MPDTKQREPQIAASLVNGVRRTLIEDGRWERIEEDVLARAPELADWLAAAERAEWVSLERYLLFMDTLLGVLGVEALETLGATRLKDDVDVGALARMLRAWLREFRSDAGALLRVAPHACRPPACASASPRPATPRTTRASCASWPATRSPTACPGTRRWPA